MGALAEAFSPDSHTPPVTRDLEGNELTLHYEDGRVVEYHFAGGGRLRWAATAGAGRARQAEEAHFAFRVRDGIYLVDYVQSDTPAAAMTLVADVVRGIATAVEARLPGAGSTGSLWERIVAGKELTAVSADFSSAAIGTPFTETTARHLPTTDLVGKRVEYTYSPTERYEHVYLNEHFYTWHCLLGSEKGLADTDRCHYYKVGDDLYLFVWREKIVPTLGLVVVDFQAMRTMGKIFGFQGAPGGGPINFAVGAHARLLNVTAREGGQAR